MGRAGVQQQPGGETGVCCGKWATPKAQSKSTRHEKSWALARHGIKPFPIAGIGNLSKSVSLGFTGKCANWAEPSLFYCDLPFSGQRPCNAAMAHRLGHKVVMRVRNLSSCLPRVHLYLEKDLMIALVQFLDIRKSLSDAILFNEQTRPRGDTIPARLVNMEPHRRLKSVLQYEFIQEHIQGFPRLKWKLVPADCTPLQIDMEPEGGGSTRGDSSGTRQEEGASPGKLTWQTNPRN